MTIDTAGNTDAVLFNGSLLGTLSHSGADLVGRVVLERMSNIGTTGDITRFDDFYVGNSPLVTPEPSSLVAFGTFGLGALGFIKRRRRKNVRKAIYVSVTGGSPEPPFFCLAFCLLLCVSPERKKTPPVSPAGLRKIIFQHIASIPTKEKRRKVFLIRIIGPSVDNPHPFLSSTVVGVLDMLIWGNLRIVPQECGCSGKKHHVWRGSGLLWFRQGNT